MAEPGRAPLYVMLDSGLKDRVIEQCARLNISQAAFTKMAIVRFVEEEERFQARAMQR